MTYLEVKLDVPAVQVASPDSAVGIDFSNVLNADTIAGSVLSDPDATEREKQLARSVAYLVDAVAEIVRGLHHGRVGVHNYPQPD